MHRRSGLALAMTMAFLAAPVWAQEDDADPSSSPPTAQAAPSPADRTEALVDDAGASGDGQSSGSADAASSEAVLRPSLGAIGLRTVARPVPPSQSAKLPVVAPALPPVNREADARGEYQPLGLRLGSFTVNGTATSGVGFRRHSVEGSETFLRSGAAVSARSDWERSSVELLLGGAFRKSLSGIDESLPEGDARLSGGLDLTDADRISAAAGWTLRDDDGKVNTLSGTLGYERYGGRIGLKSSIGVDRMLKDADPTTDNTTLSSSLRLTLDSGAVLEPFVEFGAFSRRFDKAAAGDGLSRNGLGGEAKVGVAASGDDFSGEIALGYGQEWFDEAALSDVSGLIGSAALDWNATDLLTLSGLVSTSFEPTSAAGASGILKHSGEVGVTYALAPNAFVTTGAELTLEDYAGIDRNTVTTTLKAGVGYRFNRSVEVGLDGEHKIVRSNEDGGDYRESTVTATLTLRR